MYFNTIFFEQRFVKSLGGFFPMTTPGSPDLEVRLRIGTGLGMELTTTSAGPADPHGGGTEVKQFC